jgi:pyrimidine operon attenuation protein/uracil phosphoribosyltransferase
MHWPPPSFCNNILTNMPNPTDLTPHADPSPGTGLSSSADLSHATLPLAPIDLSLDDCASLPDAEALYRILLQQVTAGIAGIEDVAIVGIHSGGAWLAERLAHDLGLAERLGVLDVSFYRDDFSEKGLRTDIKPSHIGFVVDGATIVLVDDVLYTGRTTRAALNELFDYGRPARIMLAALLDRGARQLPIAADFVAASVTLPNAQALALRRADNGQLTLTIEDQHA